MKPVLLFAVLALTACENPVKKAVRNATYSGYEMIGIEKRDLLKRRITTTRDEQKEASGSVTDALDKLRNLYAMESTQLEKQYRSVQTSYERSEKKATDVKQAREKMQAVAGDLFKEWEGEIEQIQTADLKASSREKLKDSRAQFADLNKSLVNAETKMRPVLGKLKDHVLYLKHNLNAQSLSKLKKEHGRIEGDIQSLVDSMNKSIEQADGFIRTIQ